MIDIEAHVAAIEQRARAAKISIEALCTGAGIARSTFDRWKAQKTTPTVGVLNQLYAALEQAERKEVA